MMRRGEGGMNPIVNIGGRATVRIDCKILLNAPTLDAIKIEYCSEKFWVPKSIMRDNKDGTIDLQEWFYNKKMEGK